MRGVRKRRRIPPQHAVAHTVDAHADAIPQTARSRSESPTRPAPASSPTARSRPPRRRHALQRHESVHHRRRRKRRRLHRSRPTAGAPQRHAPALRDRPHRRRSPRDEAALIPAPRPRRRLRARTPALTLGHRSRCPRDRTRRSQTTTPPPRRGSAPFLLLLLNRAHRLTTDRPVALVPRLVPRRGALHVRPYPIADHAPTSDPPSSPAAPLLAIARARTPIAERGHRSLVVP